MSEARRLLQKVGSNLKEREKEGEHISLRIKEKVVFISLVFGPYLSTILFNAF